MPRGIYCQLGRLLKAFKPLLMAAEMTSLQPLLETISGSQAHEDRETCGLSFLTSGHTVVSRCFLLHFHYILSNGNCDSQESRMSFFLSREFRVSGPPELHLNIVFFLADVHFMVREIPQFSANENTSFLIPKY